MPHTAQQVCRQITSLFLTESLKARAGSRPRERRSSSQEQLNDAKSNLDAQDAKLAAFQRENIGALPDDQDANMNMLTTLNTQLDATTQEITRLEQERSYREALLAQQGRACRDTGRAGTEAGAAPTGQATPEQADGAPEAADSSSPICQRTLHARLSRMSYPPSARSPT